jgi:transposase
LRFASLRQLRGCEEIARAVEKWVCPYYRGMSEKHEEQPARWIEANRAQMRFVTMDLESMLAQDHQARAVWAYVERLNLEAFYAAIRSREGSAGRPAVDPRIYLALWLLGMLDGVGAARELERLSRYHVAYQWICGGVQVNHHSLSDFRNLAADRLSGLLTESVSILMRSGTVQIRRVSQDGMKVRASAGASSFRTRKTLERMAAQQVEVLTREMNDEASPANQRDEQARNEANEDRAKRIADALEEMKEAEKRKQSNNGKKKTEARTSTTDPNTRVMKMADGGFRPAYNVHLATDMDTTVIVAADVNNEGTDLHAMVPLAEQVEQRHGKKPTDWVADGGCSSLDNINAMHERGCKVTAPPRERPNPQRRPTDPRPGDSEAVREWRARMETDDAKALYKRRGATAECVNAQFRGQGLLRFLVRGPKKALAVVLMHALAHNMRRTWALT